MAVTKTVVRLSHDVPAGSQLVGTDPASNASSAINRLINFIARILGGTCNGIVEVLSDAVAASSQVQAGSANGTVVVNGVSVAGNGASPTARALDAVTNINASATISPFANAALLAGDATQLVVTCVQGGKIGNGITVTVTGTGWTATGAGKLINGTDGNGPIQYKKGM